MKVIFLEEVCFVSVDPTDGERIEYRLGDGFWINKQKLLHAKKSIQKTLGEGWHLEETEYDVDVQSKQKYLYVLNHEYHLLDGTCYFYSFPPQSNRKKCLSQKKDLVADPKFAKKEGRIYDSGHDGWFIERYELIH